MSIVNWSCFFFFFLVFILVHEVHGQKVCGAEIEKDYYFPETKKLYVRVQICRQGAVKDTILFDWGDGHVEPFVRIFSINAGDGYLIDRYNGTHYYAEELDDYVELKILGEEVMEGYTNVDYSLSTDFTFSDSMLIYSVSSSPVLEYTLNEGPVMEVLGIVEYGYFEYLDDLLMYYLPIDPDTLDYQVGTFPVAGYEPPGEPEEFYMVGGLLYWESPLEPGLYAAACKISEMRFTNNPIYPPDQMTKVSTITRAFTVRVDSASLVSTLPELPVQGSLAVYPNPAADQIMIESSGFTAGGVVRIYDHLGQEVYRFTLPEGGTSLQQERVDVSRWPAGSYQVVVNQGNAQLVRQLIVQ